MSPLHDACRDGDTELVRRLLDEGAPVDEKDKYGDTALMLASSKGHTEVVRLLLGKGAAVDEKNKNGSTALMWASQKGHTKVVQLLLGKGAALDEKNKWHWTALIYSSDNGHTEVVQLLLGKGAAVDEKDKDGRTALMKASLRGRTEVVQLLLGMGASVDELPTDSALRALVGADEDQLGRMAAGLLHKRLLEGQDGKVATPKAYPKAVLQLVNLAGHARERARKLRSSDPRFADDHQALFGRLQLAAAACVQNDESGKARDKFYVKQLLGSDNGRKALEHAVKIEAKELLAQPVVQGYITVAWRADLVDFGWRWVVILLVLLLNLLFLLPLVALVPALESWLVNKLGGEEGLYILRLPVVKFGLECAADLALALALTLFPATDLATAPVAPLLLVWLGSGLLWEAHQVMAFSSDAKLWRDRMYDRLNAYWGDSINRVDATALIFSFAALVAFVSTNSEDATATSLRAVAVFLLWLRVIRVLLITPKFGPYVLMFFRMLFDDLIKFLALLVFLLLAFAASWTVLLEPEPSLLAQQFGDDQNWRWAPSHAAHLETAGSCADELGGLDIVSTLQTLVEGALTGNDFFECARDSTKSPWAAWAISLVFVTLTSVLLLNMLIAMMAKTFDNISDASATNYLFLFAQRTLALQNEPPTPPPLNALGLPYLLWKWVQQQKLWKWAQEQKLRRRVQKVQKETQKIERAEAAATCDEGDGGGDEGDGGGCEGSVAEEKTRAEAKAAEQDAAIKAAEAASEHAEVDAALEAAGDELKAAAEAEVAGKNQPLTAAKAAKAVEVAEAADDDALKASQGGGEGEPEEGSSGGAGEGGGGEGEGDGEGGGGEGEGKGEGGEGKGEQDAEGAGGGGESEGEGGIEEATETKATDEQARSSATEDGRGKDKEKAFAQKIAPLAEKITEYINDHQDDAAQEDRWRTIMKRETMKRFRQQREASDTQGKAIAEVREAIANQVRQAIDKQREASDKQREASDRQGKAIAEVREAVDKQRKAIAEVHQLIMELANAGRNA